jgi:glycosyltransferase involved in cell wall biosynthesis
VRDTRLLIVGVDLATEPPGVESLGEVVDRAELARLYGQASIFCLPSRFEPTGMSIMEGMAYGLPVVGTRVGGIAEAIRDGETGILVDSGEPRQLRDALVRLLSDPQEASRMGRNGRRWIVTDRNWDAVVCRMIESVTRVREEPWVGRADHR